MLTSLELKNFKQHEILQIDTPTGVTNIVGDNAKGKSNTLKGILFALFGASSAGSKANIWKWDSDGPKQVSLTLNLPGYGLTTITRTATGAKAMGSDGKLLASGTSPVTKLVEEAFGMSSKDLRTLCYSPQGEVRGLLTMGPTALQRKVEELAHMEVLDKALALLSTDITHMEGRLAGMPDTSSLVECMQHLEALKPKLQETEAAVQRLASEAERALEAAKEATEAKNTATAIATERVKAVASLGSKEDTLQRVKLSVEEVKTALDALTPNLEAETTAAENQVQEITSEIRNVSETIRKEHEACDEATNLAGEVAKLTKIYEEHQEASKVFEDLATHIEGARIRDQGYEDTLQRRLDRIAELQSALDNSVCPTCGQTTCEVDKETINKELEDTLTLKKSLEGMLQDNRHTVKELQAKQEGVKARLNPGAEALLADRKEKLSKLQSREFVDVPQLTEHLRLRKEALREASDTHKTLEAKSQERKHLLNQYTKLAPALNELIAEVEALQKKVANLPEVDVEAAGRHEARCREIYEGVRAKLASAKSELNQLTFDHRQTANTVTYLQGVEEELSRVAKEKSLAMKLQTYLRKNRQRLGADLWGGLLNYASALINSASRGRLGGLERSADGTFTVEQDGKRIPVDDDCLSGAQLSIVGMALRVSLNKVFYGSGLFLLLDEPAADASAATAAAIAGMLRSLNMQIISASHNHEGEVVNADNVIQL